MFERSSWILDKSATDQKAALATDLKRPSHVLVFGEREVDAFKSEPLIAGIDNSLSNSSSRFEAYATWLSDIWLQTVRIETAAETKKKSAADKKMKQSDGEDAGVGN
jgi:hypothetical protein